MSVLAQYLHFPTKAAQLLFLFGGESLFVSGIDLGLVDPRAQRLG
jgi:hypothetical protein